MRFDRGKSGTRKLASNATVASQPASAQPPPNAMEEPAAKRARHEEGSSQAPLLDLPLWALQPQRRGTEFGPTHSPAERLSLSSQAAGQVKAVWHAVCALQATAQQEGRGGGGAVDTAYQHLLAATGGCPAARLLASHFLGRFLHLAPAQGEPAVRALTGVIDGATDGQSPLGATAVEVAVQSLAAVAVASVAAAGPEAKAAKSASTALMRLAARGVPGSGAALHRVFTQAPQAVLAAFMMTCVSQDAALRCGARAWLASPTEGAIRWLRAATASCPHTAPWLLDAVRAFKAGAPQHLVNEALPSVNALLAALEDTSQDVGPAPQVPVAAATAAPPGEEVLWTGPLLKGSVPVCNVLLLRPPTTAPPPDSADALHTAGGDAREPAGWPPGLDVQQRVDHGHVLGVTFLNAPQRKRAVRRLVPATPADVAPFAEFVAYLKDKNRAGAVRLPGCSTAPPRAIYLLTPTPGTAAALGVTEPHGSSGLSRQTPFLWAAVVPTDAKQ
jgi:hypothetical protein